MTEATTREMTRNAMVRAHEERAEAMRQGWRWLVQWLKRGSSSETARVTHAA